MFHQKNIINNLGGPGVLTPGHMSTYKTTTTQDSLYKYNYVPKKINTFRYPYNNFMSTYKTTTTQEIDGCYLIKKIESFLKKLTIEKPYRKFFKRYKKLKNKIIEKYVHDAIYNFVSDFNINETSSKKIIKYIISYLSKNNHYYSVIYKHYPYDSFIKHLNKKKINTNDSNLLSFFIFSDFLISRGHIIEKIYRNRTKQGKFFSFSPLFRPNPKYSLSFWYYVLKNNYIYTLLQNEKYNIIRHIRAVTSKIIYSNLIKTRRFKNLIVKHSLICQYEILKLLNSVFIINNKILTHQSLKQEIIKTISKLERIVITFLIRHYNKFKELVMNLINLSLKYIQIIFSLYYSVGPPKT